MALGLLYHATWAYMPDIGKWYLVQDVATEPWMSALAGTLHTFRMPLFFALSGFFAHLGFERRGPTGALSERARRLGVPLVTSVPILALFDWCSRRWAAHHGLLSPEYAGGDSWLWRPLHLWFLEYLLLFVAVAWTALRWSLHRRAVPKGAAALLRPGLPPPEFWLLGAAGTGLARWALGEATPAFSYLPQPASLVQYGAFFLFGWLVWARRVAVSAQLRGRGAAWSLAGLALAVWASTGEVQWRPSGFFLVSLASWLMVAGLFGLAFALPSRPRPWLRGLVEASFWVYLIHYPLVVSAQLLSARLSAPGWLKFALVTSAVAALAFSSFFAVVRRSSLAPWLGVRSGRASGADAA
jgi:glucan biosynthesis protein C